MASKNSTQSKNSNQCCKCLAIGRAAFGRHDERWADHRGIGRNIPAVCAHGKGTRGNDTEVKTPPLIIYIVKQ